MTWGAASLSVAGTPGTGAGSFCCCTIAGFVSVPAGSSCRVTSLRFSQTALNTTAAVAAAAVQRSGRKDQKERLGL